MSKRSDQLPLASGDSPPVSFQPKSHNRKLSPVTLDRSAKPRPRPLALGPFVSSTYVSIHATCPDSCAFKSNGCYVDTLKGYNAIAYLEQRAEEWSWGGLETTLAEAQLISDAFKRGIPQDGWKGRGRDLRLHIAGDVSCESGAHALAIEAYRWGLRGGGSVWTYTHRWREIPARAWGTKLSALASCETITDIKHAHKRGYAAAITLTAFPDIRPFNIPGTDFTLMPCPAEAQNKTCVQCRLCMRASWLHERKMVIGFAIHGRDALRAKRHLRVLQGGAFDSVPLRLLP